MKPRPAALPFALIAASAMAAAPWLQGRVDAIPIRSPRTLYLMPAALWKIATLGQDMIAADFLWLKAIQHFAVPDAPPEETAWLGHLLDVVTDLDPRYETAYTLGTANLTFYSKRPELSAAVLEKGVRALPAHWKIRFYLAYNYAFHLGRFDEAAYHMEAASRLPGTAPWFPLLAARMRAEAGRPEAGLRFLIEIYKTVQDDSQRLQIAKRIRCLQTHIRRVHGEKLPVQADCPEMGLYFRKGHRP